MDKVKTVELLCKISIRFGELLPYYVKKYNILNILCYICSNRSKAEDYYKNVTFSHQQIMKDWEIFRASCLSNINDIILTLGIHSNNYMLQIIDIALGILQHEQSNSIILKRSSLYLLHTIVFLNVSCVGFNTNMANKTLFNERLRYIRIVLENLVVNGDIHDAEMNDVVCNHHIQRCLSLYS
jgi:hypothetical protein